MSWQPTASINVLKQRASLIQRIRAFFISNGLLEVETPVLSQATVTDPYISSFSASDQHGKTWYLQTSPEYAMKRLLAANSGSIFQITKAFRNDEHSPKHNNEFTMLEWYRVHYDHHQLMDEMDNLLITILNTKPAERISYQTLFESTCDINPHTASLDSLISILKKMLNVDLSLLKKLNENDALQMIMSHIIEPTIGKNVPTFVYDFPEAQAALARLRQDTKTGTTVASRFEVYFKGFELANGFHELADPSQQRSRFTQNNRIRNTENLPEIPLDEHFLASLEAGLPDCAGVALGIDRLVMIALNLPSIADALTFTTDNA